MAAPSAHPRQAGERPSHVHVVGAGLAGLAAALGLTAAGIPVTLHEAGPHPGGRARSYFDRQLGCRIDNGNHLILSGNEATMAYLDEVGARQSLTGPGTPLFPFIDLATNERWTLRPNRGPIPWWLLIPSRRVPGMRLRDMWAPMRLHRAAPDATVAQALPPTAFYRRLLEPLAIAALNTMPAEASARLLGAVMQQTLAAGGAACVPAFPREGLSETFIDPAIATLEARGADIRTGARIGALADLPAIPGGAVVLATPAPVTASLLPGLRTPDRFEAIVNVHFRLDADPGPAGFVGVVNGTAEWVFIKTGVVSTTISAGNRHLDTDTEALVQQVWHDVQIVLDVGGPLPPHRVVREKRATFAATPEQEANRPPTRTARPDVVLAGDWTATGLPATIEGAIRSGRNAAADLLKGR